MRAGQRAPSATFLRVSIAACCLSILLVCVTGELLGCAFKRSLSQNALRRSPEANQVTGVLRGRMRARLLRPQHREPLGLLQRRCAQQALFSGHQAGLPSRVNLKG